MTRRDNALALATAASPFLVVLILAIPVMAGLAGVLFPAFGYLPVLGSDSFGVDAFQALFVEPGMTRSIMLSLFTGLAATLLSLAIVMAAIGAASDTPAFRWLTSFTGPLLSVPHAAAAFGFLFLFAPSGFLARLFSPELTGWTRPPDILFPNDPMGVALIAGLVVKEVPFLLLMALSTMGQVRMIESRRLIAAFGYGRMAGFLFGIWPQLYRRLRLPVFAVLAFSTSVVDVAVILGPTNPAPLAVRLIGWMNDPDLKLRYVASAGALVLLLVTLAALTLWLMMEKTGAWILARQCGSGMRFAHDLWARRLSLVVAALTSASVLISLLLLALWSVAGLWQFPDAIPSAITYSSWQSALPNIVEPLSTTIKIACLSAGISLVVVILALNRSVHNGEYRVQNWLIYIPLIVPQAAFLFGLQLLALELSVPISIALLVAAHLVFVLPYVFLSLSDPWRGFDERYEQLAFAMGRSRWSVFWRIRLAMLTRPILTAFAVGFSVSVGLYLPTVLIGAGRLPTITTEAVALASGGNRRVIGVYAFLQSVLPFLSFLLAISVPALLFRNRRAMRH